MKASARRYEHQLLTAIDSIQAAVTQEAGWSDAMERLCDFVGARAADLNVFDPMAMQQLAYHPARIDPFILRYMADHVTDIVRRNPRTTGIYFPMPEGRIVADSDVWQPEDMRSMPFFADFLYPWGTWDSLHTWVRRTDDGRPWIALAVHYARKDCPPQAENRRRVALLSRHLRRACHAQEVLATSQRHSSDLAETLDRLREPVMLLTSGAKIVHANAAARKLLDQQAGMRRTPMEHLILDSPGAHSALVDALARCAKPLLVVEGTQPPAAQIIVPRHGAAQAVLTLQPLSHLRRQRSEAVAIAFVTAPRAADADQLDLLRTLYGFTSTEGRVVELLMEGRSLKQIAAKRNIGYETARTHMRNILAKTGASSQVRLMATLRSLV